MSDFPKFAERVVAAFACVLVFGVSAQTPHNHAAMTEAKPAAATAAPTPVVAVTTSSSALRYESVFARYQSYRDEKIGSWREANETVDRIGGWRAYAKEAQQPEKLVPSVPAAKPNPHAGHGSKP